ncbi:MAG: hypothetical protein WAX69_00590 [Victivallales bacterium]
MAKYFEADGTLKKEYMDKIKALQDKIEADYQLEHETMIARDKPLKQALEAAQKAIVKAKQDVDTCFGAWMANDQGFNLAHAKRKAQEKIMDECMTTFKTLQSELDEKDGTAERKRQLARSCQKMQLEPERLSLVEQLAKDEEESKKLKDMDKEDKSYFL